MSIGLHKNPEFSRLSVDCLARIYGMAKPLTYRKHELIVHQGAEADGLYLMQSGVAKVSIDNGDGRATILSLLRPGDMFGEIALLDGGKRMANVVAMDEVNLMKLSKADYLSLSSEYPELAQCLARYVCRRIRQADQKIGALALLDLRERISRQLRDLAMVDAAGRLVLPRTVSQGDIADMVGASREQVSRTLRELCRAGEILMQGKTMVFPSGLASEPMLACL